MLSKIIDPYYFYISLFIGIFIVYISYPVPDVIIQYPPLENTDNVIYKNDNDSCYKYIKEEINCSI